MDIPASIAAPAPGPVAGAPAGGLRIWLDPVTGELTTQPTEAQARGLQERLEAALAPALSRSDEGLDTFGLAGGGQGVYLAGRFRSAVMVRVDTEGRLVLGCYEHPGAAADHVHGDPARGEAPAPAPVDRSQALAGAPVR